MTETAIDGGFFAGILIGVAVYVAAYTLLLLILSTLAKTTGTAIMFGVLLWILYNLMWGVVTLLVTLAAGLTAADRAYYDVLVYSGMLNINTVYQGIVSNAYPGATNAFFVNGQEYLPLWGPLAVACVWIVVLFGLAVWVFNRKATE
jgi:ABC-type transport system involved in multi-copper enzyme maturation permease subunit